MVLVGEDTGYASSFSHESLDKLTALCVDYFRKSLRKEDPDVCRRRSGLAKYVRKFHEECGTLTSYVSESLRNLEDESCLLLMTAHQPNLFAYGGVLRKVTLNRVLEEKLSKSLNVPVVSFFGVADQDFTDDRWVRSALLPDVQRRNGCLELRFDMPRKLMLNRSAKPSRGVLHTWRGAIENWLDTKLCSIARDCRFLGLQSIDQSNDLAGNFESFWAVVEDAYGRAENYADFNAFLMSWIVNRVWGYDTLFSRFSECQQIFEREFGFLLSRFDDYSCYVREAMVDEVDLEAGVYEREFETVPFWYHCGCGSKARLEVEQNGARLAGYGRCVRCDREYHVDFGSKHEPQISEIVTRISARSISMPLVFFQGLSVGCYVGGVGGTVYLKQAERVAGLLKTLFPPVAVWRPKDSYLGVGQVEALMVFRRLSGTFDFSQYRQIVSGLREKVALVQREVAELEIEKQQCASSGERKGECVKRLKVLSARQAEVRREAGFSVLVRNIGLLENVAAALGLHPCIVDYAVNVGLRETSDQWVAFLQGNGHLLSDVKLRTGFDGIELCVQPRFGG